MSYKYSDIQNLRIGKSPEQHVKIISDLTSTIDFDSLNHDDLLSSSSLCHLTSPNLLSIISPAILGGAGVYNRAEVGNGGTGRGGGLAGSFSWSVGLNGLLLLVRPVRVQCIRVLLAAMRW